MSKGLTFKRSSDGFFKIGESALEMMQYYIQDKATKPEAGGVLLGRHIIDTNNIIVDDVTIPTPEDCQTRFRFFRSKDAHQRVIDQKWAESKFTCTYLGEWHTHPESVPMPSVVDKANWKRKLMFDRFSQAIFFVIVGIHTVRIWEGQIRRLQLLPLEILE